MCVVLVRSKIDRSVVSPWRVRRRSARGSD